MSLTQVFATILAYCSPSAPINLWGEQNAYFLTEIRHRLRRTNVQYALDSDEQAIAYTPLEIQNYFQGFSRKSLQEFQFPTPPQDLQPLQVPPIERNLTQIHQEVYPAISNFKDGQPHIFNQSSSLCVSGASVSTLEGPASPTALQLQPKLAKSGVFFLIPHWVPVKLS